MTSLPHAKDSGSPATKPEDPPSPGGKPNSPAPGLAVRADNVGKNSAGAKAWPAYVLGAIGLLVGGIGVYLALDTQRQANEKIQLADQKIQSTEKGLGDLRSTHEQARVALEKKIQDDTGKLQFQLESAEGQLQKLEEQGKVVARELEVISNLKMQQQSLESRLDGVDKSSRETSRRLEATQAGLEDLRKTALKANITPQTPGARTAPVGMKLYLTRESLAAIAQANGIPGAPTELAEKWKNLFLNPSGNAQGQKIENAVSRSAVATGVVGGDGTAELQRVPPGDYYVLGATGQGGGFVYEKKITVDQSTDDFLLNR